MILNKKWSLPGGKVSHLGIEELGMFLSGAALFFPDAFGWRSGSAGDFFGCDILGDLYARAFGASS